MANWLTGAFNELVEAVIGTPIKIEGKLTFNNTYSAIDFNLDDVINKRAVIALIPSVLGGLTIAVPSNPDGFYDYPYDGSLGVNPTAYLQIAITSPSSGWQKVVDAKILDNGHVYVEADFSIDVYQLIIKP